MLVGGVGLALRRQFLLKPALGFLEPSRPWLRNRAGLAAGAARLAGAWPHATSRAGPRGLQLGRQLIAARLAIELVLSRVDGLGFFEDLARDLLVIEVLVATRVRVQLGPVDRDNPDLGQPASRTPTNLTEQTRDRVLVALDEPRDRRVIGPLLRRDNPERDILITARSIIREDRIPRAYAYSNRPTIIAGS